MRFGGALAAGDGRRACLALVVGVRAGGVVWDIGAGTGSISVEAGLIAAPGSVQYHFVDFSDHRVAPDRFATLYGHHPDEIRCLYRRRGLHVNMLRPSDVEAAFARHFSVERTVFLANAENPSVRSPAPWWAEHYDLDDLAIEVAAFNLTKG